MCVVMVFDIQAPSLFFLLNIFDIETQFSFVFIYRGSCGVEHTQTWELWPEGGQRLFFRSEPCCHAAHLIGAGTVITYQPLN